MKLGNQFRENVLALEQLSEEDAEQKKQIQTFKNLQFTFKPFKDQLAGVRDPQFVLSG